MPDPILPKKEMPQVSEQPVISPTQTEAPAQSPTPETIPEAPPIRAEPTPEMTPPTEQPEQPSSQEQPAREIPQTLDDGIESLKKKLRRPKKKKPTTVPQVRDEITVKVEKIMEDGLADAYKELTPVQQQEFKIKGEETALKIRQLMSSAKVKLKSIFRLLLEWLKLLPGVNLFFLEQEAKIRADKIMTLKEQYFPKK